jgi:hypothetical protein
MDPPAAPSPEWVGRGSVEPCGHALGRSRGGFSCKLHLICDGRGLPLSVGLTSGNVNDTLMLGAALTEIRIPRRGPGRPRTRPNRLLGDKGYSSAANRRTLARRGITVTIPERADQLANRGHLMILKQHLTTAEIARVIEKIPGHHLSTTNRNNGPKICSFSGSEHSGSPRIPSQVSRAEVHSSVGGSVVTVGPLGTAKGIGSRPRILPSTCPTRQLPMVLHGQPWPGQPKPLSPWLPQQCLSVASHRSLHVRWVRGAGRPDHPVRTDLANAPSPWRIVARRVA